MKSKNRTQSQTIRAIVIAVAITIKQIFGVEITGSDVEPIVQEILILVSLVAAFDWRIKATTVLEWFISLGKIWEQLKKLWSTTRS